MEVNLQKAIQARGQPKAEEGINKKNDPAKVELRKGASTSVPGANPGGFSSSVLAMGNAWAATKVRETDDDDDGWDDTSKPK